MSNIVKPDWSIFKVKFSGQEQAQFEWLCYLLFCKEFNQPKGILRYVNQAGIETTPIEVSNKFIGWQARFYETKLSEHKKEFIKSIKTTKQRHPKINKIIFYTNKDFGQNSEKTEPVYKKEIESHAKSKNIQIEWRTKSYFESPFVCEENKQIAQHFFTLEKSIFNFIEELFQHTSSILNPIKSTIEYNDNNIKIDRSTVLEQLKTNLIKSPAVILSGEAGTVISGKGKTILAPAVILSGEAGTGKTAIIKDFYSQHINKDATPFFIFKAVEFNSISHINELFKNYGNFTLLDLIKEYTNVDIKYVVIDSAEKLSECENREPFKELLNTLIQNNWKIIFTTRYSYLDDLRYLILEIQNINCPSLNITKLTHQELNQLSKNYNFILPESKRLLKLLHNPFYLNEYLRIAPNLDRSINYLPFKGIIWQNKICNSSYQKNNIHRKREECFLKIAQKKANTNSFFVDVNECDSTALQSLKSDEIIEYNSNTGKYFISHDIYEEWALDKIIEREFCNRTGEKHFYESIGSSLPIRRAFRIWLSNKLSLEDEDIKHLIEYTINNREIENHWRDETLISVLLSNYCFKFFEMFEDRLLQIFTQIPDSEVSHDTNLIKDNLLYKILFLLRVACKTVDENMLAAFGLSNKLKQPLQYIFIKPKGKGWDCAISFINQHKNSIKLKYINLILPILDEWNQKNKKDQTTQKASKIALFYYEEIMNHHKYSYSEEIKKTIIKVILNGSFEIKSELESIFQSIISKKEVNRNSKYNQLVHTILTSAIDSNEIAKHFPEQLINLAELFWIKSAKEDNEEGFFPRTHDRLSIEECFSITSEYEFKYNPASPLKVPIFPLLRFSLEPTIDFILSFTNKAIEHFIKSEFSNQIQKVDIFINEDKKIHQYISPILWGMYRGNSNAPDLLESIHMALEKYLLEYGKHSSRKSLEKLLLHLIENSQSASITSVVSSIVLAYPEKTFNVAKILFQTREFFLYDNTRYYSDRASINNNFISPNLNYIDQVYQKKKKKSDKLQHRKMSLEHLALNYQLCKNPETSEEEVKKRKTILWDIFDKHCSHLSDSPVTTDAEWRMCLARMDTREMNPKIEQKGEDALIHLNPTIDPELRKYSEKIVEDISKSYEYTSLYFWAKGRFEGNKEQHQKYTQYENNIELIIKETKEVIEKIKTSTNQFPYQEEYLNPAEATNKFALLNNSTPIYVCSVLIRDYLNQLNLENKKFCKEIIIQYTSLIFQFQNQYRNHMKKELGLAINMLPVLLNFFPLEKNKIKRELFLTLFIKECADDTSNAISQNLWNRNLEDAHSMFLGYLLLKSKFDKIEKCCYENHICSNKEILETFVNQNQNRIKEVVLNKIKNKDILKQTNIVKLDLQTLITAFKMLPLKLERENHKKFAKQIITICVQKFFIDHRNSTNHFLRSSFLEKLSLFLLFMEKDEINTYLQPFIDNFNNLKYMNDFFEQLIFSQDICNQYDNFWTIWNAFYSKIVELCKNNTSPMDDFEVISTYLLAGSFWKESTRSWHTLKNKDKLFLKKALVDMKYHPVVLYSILKIFSNVGYQFRDEGIFWISSILDKNQSLSHSLGELEPHIIFDLENLVRGYILKNHQRVKQEVQIKNKILIILNFLLQKSSATAYRLREDIL